MTADLNTRIVPFAPDDLRLLALQPQQADFYSQCCNAEYAEALAQSGPAWTAWRGTRVVACGGIQTLWPGRGCAWLLLAADVGAAMVLLLRYMRRVLLSGQYRRVEAAAACGFAEGARMLQLLGFKREVAGAAYYMPDGKSADLYAFTGGRHG